MTADADNRQMLLLGGGGKQTGGAEYRSCSGEL